MNAPEMIPPGDHDPGDPDPVTDPVQDHVRGHLEQEVANEEQACAEAVDRVAELQLLRHLTFGEADVHPVQVGDHVAKHHERHEAPEHLRVGLLDEFIRRRGGPRECGGWRGHGRSPGCPSERAAYRHHSKWQCSNRYE
jgi:hypothetical protein